jgi:iron complex outermembrane recepter protein
MKQFFGAIVAFFLVLTTSAQYTIQGTVLGKQNNKPLPGVTVSLIRDNNTVQTVTTNDNSNFEIRNLKKSGRYTISAASIGFKTTETIVDVNDATTNVLVELEEQPYFLEPLEVKSVRVSEKAPFAKTNVSKQEIAKNNLGQDLPFLLNQTPSVVVNSDAGNGIGYTGIRIRGSDATRTNVIVEVMQPVQTLL